jgi:hypothetical protein
MYFGMVMSQVSIHIFDLPLQPLCKCVCTSPSLYPIQISSTTPLSQICVIYYSHDIYFPSHHAYIEVVTVKLCCLPNPPDLCGPQKVQEGYDGGKLLMMLSLSFISEAKLEVPGISIEVCTAAEEPNEIYSETVSMIQQLSSHKHQSIH